MQIPIWYKEAVKRHEEVCRIKMYNKSKQAQNYTSEKLKVYGTFLKCYVKLAKTGILCSKAKELNRNWYSFAY